MTNDRHPVLAEADSSLDWRSAAYTVNVGRVGDHHGVKVSHELKDAPSLADAVRSGKAEYAVEVRCPRSLLSYQRTDSEPTWDVNWDADDVRDDSTFILAGVVSRGGLRVDRSELHDFFSSGDTPFVELPLGWWAARAQVRRLNPLLKSLVEFSPNSSLSDGEMRVSEKTSNPDGPRFRIELHPDMLERARRERDIQIAGLIGVFGLLPKSSLALGNDNDDHTITRDLRQRLDDADPPILDWDEELYDPAAAATYFEPFFPLSPSVVDLGIEEGE